MAGFPHPGDDDAALPATPDQVDGGDERLAEAVVHGGDYGVEAAKLGLEGAQRRFDVRMARYAGLLGAFLGIVEVQLCHPWFIGQGRHGCGSLPSKGRMQGGSRQREPVPKGVVSEWHSEGFAR